MTRVSTTVDISSFTTDAKFRTWGSTISAALASAGLVQTADTGQVNWVTVSRPVTAGAQAGYEIWRFNDALQSTAPIYIRLVYCTGGQAAGQNPMFQFSVGTGTDGAGNLVNPISSALNGPSVSNTSASTNPSQIILATHTAGYALLYTSSTIAGSPGISTGMMAIERSRNQTTGAATSSGVLIWRGTFNSTTIASSTTYAAAFAPFVVFSGGVNTPMMPPGDSANYGAYLFPVYICLPQPTVAVGMVGYMVASAASWSTFTAKPIGSTTTHTYICIPDVYASMYGADAITNISNEANVRCAFLWED